MKSTTKNSLCDGLRHLFAGGISLPRVCFVLVAGAMLALAGCGGDSSDEGIDPGVIEIPIAYIKRPAPQIPMGETSTSDMRDPMRFTAGGDVYLRSSTGVAGSEEVLTRSITGGRGDIKGLNVSYDGLRLIFSLRLEDPDPNDDIVPTWNIYEYDLEQRTLSRVISSELIAEQGDDLFPAYLPDGRIVFTSNRQTQNAANLINEGKPIYRALDEDRNSFALLLHVMNDDGTEIRQISYNQSHDLYPQVLTNLKGGGKIVFTRWDNVVGDRGMHFYTVNPDGSELEFLYGINSHDTGTGGGGEDVHFFSPRETEEGDLMVITRPYEGTFEGGKIEIVDAARFVDNNRPIWSLQGLAGPAQRPATINDVANDGAISTVGRYSSAWPVWDGSNRILVSKSTCQLTLAGRLRPCIDPYISNPAAVEASPAYAIWLYDRDVDTEKPIVLAEPNRVITEAVTVQERILPRIIFENGGNPVDSDQEDDNVGVINIKSVYDMGDTGFDGCFFGYCTAAGGITGVEDFADPLNATADQRPVRFVRFIRPVGLPDEDDPNLVDPPQLINESFGINGVRVMREIVGYAPVEPDGSVKVRVPANLPLSMEFLDGEGRRVGPSHRNWIQVPPGSMLTCNGCHVSNTGGPLPVPHGRADATALSINSGLPAGLEFVNTQIPGRTFPYFGDFGQTMAEVRFDRVNLEIPPAVEPELSIDLVYDDYWTDPAVRAPDASYAYRYSDLDTSLASPANIFCSPWAFNCRSIINYPAHIHEIWQLDRGADAVTMDAPANPLPGDPTNTPLVVINTPNGIGDDTCTECHTTLAGTRVPYGQLDLSTDPAQNPNDFFRSYLELLQTDAAQTFDGANVVDIDPAVAVDPSMSPNGARASYFMEKMTGVELDHPRTISGTVDHTGMLTAAELKLISEWLDLDARNFNDPFDPQIPQN